MSPSHVTFVCQWYAPEPVVQASWIVEALIDQGHDVDVLTGIPNYPSGDVAPGYRWWRVVRERVSGVDVLRAPLYASHDQSAAKRMANYLSWALSSSLVGFRRLRRADVALVYSSPATAALPALVAKLVAGTPYVLLIQDVWPDSIFSSGFMSGRFSAVVERILGALVGLLYRQAAHIAVISPGMADLLASRGVPHGKLSVVYNWVAEESGAPPTTRDLRAELGVAPDDFLLMYAGNHGAAQALEAVIEAVATVNSERAVHLVLIGEGVEKPTLVARVEERGYRTVHFLAPVVRAEMDGLMCQADVQVVSLARRPLFAVTTPSKLQSIMAAAQPVLVVADGDAATLATSAGAGVSAGAEDISAIRTAVERLVAMDPTALKLMGERGRQEYQSVMSAQVGANRLSRLLEAAAAGKERRP